MKKLCAIYLTVLYATVATSQVIGKTTSEDYVADFEKQASIWSIPEYDGDPIQDDIAMLVVKNALEQLEKKETMEEYKEINNDKS